LLVTLSLNFSAISAGVKHELPNVFTHFESVPSDTFFLSLITA